MNIFFQHDYPNFGYEAWGSTHHCFLRVRVFSDGVMAVFCSTVHHDKLAESTRNITVILRDLVKQLAEGNHLPGKAWPQQKSRHNGFVEKIVKRTRFVEHAIGFHGESFALVNFANGESTWSYKNKESMASLAGLDIDFITHPLDVVQTVSPDSDADGGVRMQNLAVNETCDFLAGWSIQRDAPGRPSAPIMVRSPDGHTISLPDDFQGSAATPDGVFFKLCEDLLAHAARPGEAALRQAFAAWAETQGNGEIGPLDVQSPEENEAMFDAWKLNLASMALSVQKRKGDAQ